MHAETVVIGHRRFRNTHTFNALDGLRAVSVFLVFTTHFGGAAWVRWSGWLGVHIFFVLSGWLITTLLLREREATGRVSLAAFHVRRATRLLPVYVMVYLGLLVSSYLAGGNEWQQMKEATPWYFSLRNELAPLAALARIPPIAPFLVTWTLGVEWKYYLAWPALLALGGATPRAGLATALTGMAMLGAVEMAGAEWTLFLPRNYVGLLAGSTLALFMHSQRGFAWTRILTKPVFGVVAIALVLWCTRRFPWVIAHFGLLGGITLYAVLVALAIPVLVDGRTRMARALGANWLVYIGRRSYAMYLLQYIAANTVTRLSASMRIALSPTLFTVAAFALALAASAILYRWFEKPINDWGHRVARNRFAGLSFIGIIQTTFLNCMAPVFQGGLVPPSKRQNTVE